ncbi:MAG TPA: hypothetical protein VJ868_03310 [Actinomycetota bacterium]|nr:hypothetical protein [Actinomycetota bacterium]
MEDYQDALDRIEREVRAGSTDLSGLGFWRLVRQVKREPALARHWADDVGRIDRLAFEARVRPRFPVWFGNAVLLVGTALCVGAAWLGIEVARDDPSSILAGILVLGGGAGLSPAVHDLGHWVVGRLAGIRFLAYFLDGPFRIQPGIKVDYTSYLRVSPGRRAAMHAAGAVASKIAPFAVFAWAYLAHRRGGYELLPEWSLWALLAFGVGQLITDAVWSTRASDWKRVRRERRIARAAS